AVDLFAERQVLSLQFLRPFPIFDVGRRDVPPPDPAIFLTKRSVVKQEPAVGSILRAHAGLELEGFAARKLLAIALKLLDVVGVAHRSKEVRSAKLLYRAAKIVERGSIPVEPLAVRVEDDDVLRNGDDEIAKVLLVLCDEVLVALALVDVGARVVPSH